MDLTTARNTIWAELINTLISPAFITLLKSHNKYKKIAAERDVCGLLDLACAQCQEHSGDRIGDIQARMDLVHQAIGMGIADVKGKLDPLLEEMAMALGVEELDEATKMRAVSAAINPSKYTQEVKDLRKTTATNTNESMCRTLQEAEDKLRLSIQAVLL